MFRKPKKKPSALRISVGDGDTTGSAQLNNNTKKRPRQTRDSSSSDDNDSHDDDDAANNTSDILEQIRQERNNNDNRRNNKALLNTSSTTFSSSKKKSTSMMHHYKSNNQEVQLSAQEMATRTAEYHPTTTTDNNNNNDNPVLPFSLQNQPRNKFLAGPLKATTFVRTTARFDYQPDICKDYKETGFCGFGDTCIYLHDRGDTKSGWQMEQEYEENKKKEEERKAREMDTFMNSMMCAGGVATTASGGGGGSKTAQGDDDGFGGAGNNEHGRDDVKNGIDDGIPYACHICRGPFQNPVVTTCGHYFCESCMQSRIRESDTNSSTTTTTCPICQKDTHGVLNYPQKLVAKKRRLVGRNGTWEEYLAKKWRDIYNYCIARGRSQSLKNEVAILLRSTLCLFRLQQEV